MREFKAVTHHPVKLAMTSPFGLLLLAAACSALVTALMRALLLRG